MKIYNSFLLRCWLLREVSQEERSVFEIQHVQSGERQRVVSLDEVHDWINRVCEPKRRPAESPEEGVEVGG